MNIQDKVTVYSIRFSRKYILEIWHTCEGSETERARRVLEKIMHMVPDSENCDIEVLRQCIQKLSKRLMEYWKKATRSLDKLKKSHLEWLEHHEVVDIVKSSATGGASFREIVNIQQSFGASGRPKKDFSECSKRSQRRRLADLSKVDESAITTLKDTSSHSDTKTCEIVVDEVISLLAEAKLTKNQYMLVKNFVNSKISPVMPSYQTILDAKKRCYPINRTVSETSAEVELQCLLDHTATRIVDLQEEVLSSIDHETLGDLFLIGKWGFDGSSAHAEYKQSFSENPELDDGSMLVTSYVPLRPVSFVQTTGVIENMMISIGELSEEAAESTNKNIKSLRLNNTRKFSRELTNSDLLNRLLLNSDPLITSLRELPRKKKATLGKSVISLLDI